MDYKDQSTATVAKSNGNMPLAVRKDAKSTQKSGGNSKRTPLVCDAYDGLRVNTESQYPHYSTAGSVNPASAATDVLTLTGSASGIICVKKIILSGQITSATKDQLVDLIYRLTANSGGTSTDSHGGTAAAGTGIIARDPGQGASVATFRKYTVSPTLGTAGGTAGSGGTATGIVMRDKFLARVADTGNDDRIVFDFGNAPFILRAATDVLAVNLLGTSQDLANLDYMWEWFEAPTTA